MVGKVVSALSAADAQRHLQFPLFLMTNSPALEHGGVAASVTWFIISAAAPLPQFRCALQLVAMGVAVRRELKSGAARNRSALPKLMSASARVLLRKYAAWSLCITVDVLDELDSKYPDSVPVEFCRAVAAHE